MFMIINGCAINNRVYVDDEEWFRSIFAKSDKDKAIQNQYEFLVQRMGGPPLYSQRRGQYSLFYFLLFIFLFIKPSYFTSIRTINKQSFFYRNTFSFLTFQKNKYF